MKKTKALALALVMVVFASMSLGSGSSSSEPRDIVTDDQSASSDDKTENSEEQEAAAEVTIEEQVLFEQDGIKVTATAYESDSIWGDDIKLLVENDSDQDVTVGSTALIVNNYMITDLFSATVAAGKKSNEKLSLSTTGLKAAGIDAVGLVEVYFHVYNADTWDDLFTTDCIAIKTSAYDTMDTTVDDSGAELYNEGGIRIIGKTVDEDSFWGTAILLYIENNSGRNVGISVDDMSINGFMMTPLFSKQVYDGKMAYEDIDILSSELEENGIESIEEVELKFHIFDSDTYETITDSDSITFSAK